VQEGERVRECRMETKDDSSASSNDAVCMMHDKMKEEDLDRIVGWWVVLTCSR
jgi:hypothetical protein